MLNSVAVEKRVLVGVKEVVVYEKGPGVAV